MDALTGEIIIACEVVTCCREVEKISTTSGSLKLSAGVEGRIVVLTLPFKENSTGLLKEKWEYDVIPLAYEVPERCYAHLHLGATNCQIKKGGHSS
ncbi:hypothetical protein AAC387_Pa12g0648 [Persea americana]